MLLSVIAFFSYPLYFARFPVTRDVPWVNLLLFLIAASLVIMGVRGAYRPGSRRGSRISAAIATALAAAALGLFVVGVFVMGRQLPTSKGAPRVGQKAPDFLITNRNGQLVSLSQLLVQPLNGAPPKGVLLVFYRGYW